MGKRRAPPRIGIAAPSVADPWHFGTDPDPESVDPYL
jgi:hypothetical protein